MPRTVPGSGAAIFPVFNSIYGVREVYVTAGGSGYDPADPPRLRIENCGTPIRDAVLRPVIEGISERSLLLRCWIQVKDMILYV